LPEPIGSKVTGTVVHLASHIPRSTPPKAQEVGACLTQEGSTVAVDGFVAWCVERGYSPRTIAQYRWVLERFAGDVGDPLSAGADEIRAWLARWTDAKASTRRAYRSTLASFYTWAVSYELVALSPMGRVPKPKVPIGQPRPIAQADYDAALEAAGERMRCWLLLAGDAGLRRAEISALRRGQIMGTRLHVMGKGARARTVPLSRRLRAALEAWPADDRMWQAGPGHLGWKVAEHLRACGVDGTCHQLRHLFGTQFFKASGGDLRRTQQVMGHGSPSVTAQYVAFLDDLDDIIDRMTA
jgi:integrase